MLHEEKHELSGKTVALKPLAVTVADGVVLGANFVIEDWYDRVAGFSWQGATGNPAALKYSFRSGFSGGKIPFDNEVVYGKIGPYGHLIHVSELGEVLK